MQIISRKEALNQGLTHYFTGKPCKHGHTDIRFAKDGACKACAREKRARQYNQNPEQSKKSSSEWKAKNKEHLAAYMVKWRRENKDHVESYSEKYRSENAERRRQQKEDWRKKNIEHVRAYATNRYRTNINHKLSHIMRGMVQRVVSNGKSSQLNYNFEQLKKRIEMQFKDGMSWSNHGEWHIDHIIPVSELIRCGVTDPAKINALENLRPMWAKDNISKGDRFDLAPPTTSFVTRVGR